MLFCLFVLIHLTFTIPIYVTLLVISGDNVPYHIYKKYTFNMVYTDCVPLHKMDIWVPEYHF